jgi:hypothetical protein
MRFRSAVGSSQLFLGKSNYCSSSEFKEELKEAAFKSHSKAYVSGGLTIVAMLSPNALWRIGHIPRVEFSLLSRNFRASVEQVLDTIEKVIPEMAGVAMATLAGPAHTRSLKHAHQMDMNTVWGKKRVIDSLNWLKGAIRRRELDAPPILDEIIRRLNAREFPDMGTAKLAREVIKAAQTRNEALSYTYRLEVANDPSLRFFYNKYLEGWER